MKKILKTIVKSLLPAGMTALLRRLQRRILMQERPFAGLANKQIFEKIYRENIWGGTPSDAPFSGDGSHDPVFVEAYVKAISDFLNGFDSKKVVVDLGCGDFNIGSKIAPMASRYIACDIVEDVIVHIKAEHRGLGDHVDFLVLDLVNDELPHGDIVFVRQVLQHLCNDDIEKFCAKIRTACCCLVVTEHLPRSPGFVPNIDKPSGSGTRLMCDSGVVLTQPPFDLDVVEDRPICEVEKDGVVLRTTVYRFRA